MSKKKIKTTEYTFFNHRKCEYFPCHPTNDPDNFNCLFCFCPLYALGEKCGGNYQYLPNGYKDCSSCTFPHHRKNYDVIMERFHDIQALAARQQVEEPKKD